MGGLWGRRTLAARPAQRLLLCDCRPPTAQLSLKQSVPLTLPGMVRPYWVGISHVVALYKTVSHTESAYPSSSLFFPSLVSSYFCPRLFEGGSEASLVLMGAATYEKNIHLARMHSKKLVLRLVSLRVLVCRRLHVRVLLVDRVSDRRISPLGNRLAVDLPRLSSLPRRL